MAVIGAGFHYVGEGDIPPRGRWPLGFSIPDGPHRINR